MKQELFSKKTLAGAVGTAAIGLAMGSSPAFAAVDLNQGYQQGSSAPHMLAQGSCGEATCGASGEGDDQDKDSEGSCGANGDGEEKDSEGACGEGTCGG
ncbi:hypothetical protein [Thioalkalivibrio sp. ARh3]|uniref:hypothetical protein n=1 Tax=Thioalkalivibrio sp. ARh3 TaxID=1158148 RepID=UPI00038228A0|nr:hypothetical protein [Thioalkalivibrio sp. ARh3]